MRATGIKVIMLMAMTLDGKIAKSKDHFPDWTGPEDKKMFVRLTKKAGALIMGSKTFDTIGKPLPKRKNIIMTRKKDRVSRWDNLVFTGESPEDILAALSKEGYTEVVLAGGSTINAIFARKSLIDEIVVTVSPLVFGEGLSLFDSGIAMDLELLEVTKLGEQLVYLRYRVNKNN